MKDKKLEAALTLAERIRPFEPTIDKIRESVKDFDVELKEKALGMGFTDTELKVMGFK